MIQSLSSIAGVSWLRSVALLALAGACFGGGLRFGIDRAELRCTTEKLAAVEAASARYKAEVEAGQATVAALRSELDQASQFDQSLKESLPRVQVIASAARCSRPAAVPVPPGGGAATQSAAVAAAIPSAPSAIAVGDGDDRARLTAGAVSVWDSALAGVLVPSGACRADDPSGAACAAATPITAEDAWADHTANAASCRADRIRYQRLIDHLNRRGATASNPHP